ncbi:MAG: MMPL family transporter [Clostridia bacterium]|nr:MMPL family transporter [Clostridia bacterium]
MDWLARTIRKHPILTIALTVALTLVFIYGATRIRVSSGQREFFPKSDPTVQALERVDEAFGGSDYVMIAMPSSLVFTVDGVRALDDLTVALAELDGVNSVRSITNMVEMRETEFGIEAVRILEAPLNTQAEADAFRARLTSNKQISSVMASGNGEYILTLVQLARGVESGRIAKAVLQTTREMAPGLKARYAGAPVLTVASDDYLKSDMTRLFPISGIVILLTLIASFRRVDGVVLPLLTVLAGTVWTLGLMGFVHVPLTQITAVLPVVLLSTGSAYGIHIMARYYEESRNGLTRPDAVVRTVETVGVPVILAGITTVAGFGANAFSSIVRIREFGLLAAFGVGCALAIALTFVPAMLITFGSTTVSKAASSGAGAGRSRHSDARPYDPVHSRAYRWFRAIAGFVLARRVVVIVVAVVLIAFSLAGLTRLSVDTSFASFFAEESDTRRDFDLIRSEFGGVDTVQIMLEGDILDPATLSAMDSAQRDFEATEGYGTAFSVVDVAKQVSRAMHDDDPAWERVPATREEAAQYLLVASLSGDVGLDQMISLDNTQARIQVMADSAVNSAKRGKTLEQAREIVRRSFSSLPTITAVSVTGLPFLEQGMGEQIMRSQIESLIIAALGVALIVYFSFGRSLDSIVCLVPIVITILSNFGLMGWAHVPVNVVTALVSSIAVGIGIDYSVHVYSRFRQGIANGLSGEDAIRDTISNTGQAVVLNAGAVALGFAVLLFSKFPPLRQFGMLIAATMAVSAGGALSILPVILLAVRRDGRARAGAGRDRNA